MFLKEVRGGVVQLRAWHRAVSAEQATRCVAGSCAISDE